MRSLSWKQPFATAMLYGKIETRTWDTKYRGSVLICASKKEYQSHELKFICGGYYIYDDMIEKIGGDASFALLGHAIAVGDLVDTRKMREKDQSKCFVEFREDLFCHIYENVRRIVPVAWKGTQGWKTLDDNFVNSIQYL